MLRLSVLILLLANAGYYAWSQGLLAPWGFAPVQQSEPQRLAQQVKPQLLRVLPSDEARRIEVAAGGAARGPECLQAGPLGDERVARVQQVLQAWPAGSWTLEPTVEPARWIVYMGKYTTQDSLNRKKAELRARGVLFEPVSSAALEPGLSLGGFASQAAAQQHLERLAQRGVRTARVAQEREEVRGQLLRIATVDDALRPRLEELRPALGGASLRSCR